MDKERKEKVWTAFWNQQRQSNPPAVVSAEWNAISRAQFLAWTDFAAPLPQGARVLDIATGSGKVPLMLQGSRPDLALTGIDIAQPLPDPGHGIRLVGGVSMDALPFDDHSFDVGVSQFGFEYGESGTTGTEMLRVLEEGGPIGLMLHRGDGPILAHNRRREEQIRWVRQERRIIETTRKLLPDEGVVAREAQALAASVAQEGREKFGADSVAWEIAEAVRLTLELAPRGTRQQLLATLAAIEEQSDNELGRIASLTNACASADDRSKLLAPFMDAGRGVVDVREIGLPGEPPFADLITL